jgi:hypothetical protein
LPQLFEKETYTTRSVYVKLLKNREILYYHTEILGDVIDYRDLLGKGFNFKYFTSIYNAPDGGTYYFCFDYGYHVHGEKVFILERPEEAQ